MKVLWDALTPYETRLSTGQKLFLFLHFVRNNSLMTEGVVGGLRTTSSFRVGFLFIKIQKSYQIKQNCALLHTEGQTTFANEATAHICTGPALAGSVGNSTTSDGPEQATYSCCQITGCWSLSIIVLELLNRVEPFQMEYFSYVFSIKKYSTKWRIFSPFYPLRHIERKKS